MFLGVSTRKGWLTFAFIILLVLYIGASSHKSSVNWSNFLPSRPNFADTSGLDAGITNFKPDSLAPLDSLAYPADYLVPSKDHEWCENIYGKSYLDHLAENHVPYCTPLNSKGKLECFRTHNGEDELCIARGVRFDPAQPYSGKSMALHCDLRNFTMERINSPAKAVEIKDVKNLADFNLYFYETGAGPQLWDWDISPSDTSLSEERCDATKNDGNYYILVRREANRNVWHKLMEMWQVQISLDVLQMAINGETKSPFIPPKEVHNIDIVFEDDEEVGGVWQLWGMVTGKEPIRLSSLSATCMGNVILPLAGSSSPFWKSSWAPQDCKSTFLLDPYLRRVYRHLGIESKQRLIEETVVTVIDRKNRRRIYDLENKIERLKPLYPGVKFQLIDFATLSLREQIEIIQGTDVLFGTLGAGMTHVLFLPPQSSVAEIMPSKIAYGGFRNLAKLRGLQYYTIHAETQDEWAMHDEVPDEVKTDDETTVIEARDWQTDKWVFVADDAFQKLANAAINGQLNRGLRNFDVT